MEKYNSSNQLPSYAFKSGRNRNRDNFTTLDHIDNHRNSSYDHLMNGLYGEDRNYIGRSNYPKALHPLDSANPVNFRSRSNMK